MSGDADEPAPSPGQLLASGVVFYVLLAAAGLAWMSLRDRLDVLPDLAVGAHGPWLASSVGLGLGVLLALFCGQLAQHSREMRAADELMRRTFDGMGQSAVLTLVLLGAVAEELFLRLAVQDAFGLVGSVAAFALVSMALGRPRLLLLAVVHATMLGAVVQLGFGLLASTTANAIMNHLNLRRLSCR